MWERLRESVAQSLRAIADKLDPVVWIEVELVELESPMEWPDGFTGWLQDISLENGFELRPPSREGEESL